MSLQSLKIQSLTEYKKQYAMSIENPSLFWNQIASKFLWKKRWDVTLNWNFDEPKITWFDGGMFNITENIFERNLTTQKDSVALIWEPNLPSEENRFFTYQKLFLRSINVRMH